MTNNDKKKNKTTIREFDLKPMDGGTRYKGERLGNIPIEDFRKKSPEEQKEIKKQT